MPTLSPAYAVPQRGSNSDFNNTFAVTITGTAGAYTCADAWVTRAGTFSTQPTAQENLFMHDWAQGANTYVFYAYGMSIDNNAALAQYVQARKALTWQQIANPADNTNLRFNANGVAINAWQTAANSPNASCWSRGPNRVRAPLNLGYVATPNGSGKYIVAAGASTCTAYATAWNNFIFKYYGVLPSDPLDPVFSTDIFYWGMLTAPLNPTDVPIPAGTVGSAFIEPYIDGIKAKWGPYSGL